MPLNTVTLVGRAGRDPEIKYFESGAVVAKFSLAVDRQSRNKEADWFDVEMWDKTAEIAANYVLKGKLIGIEGSLKFEKWIDKATGEQRSKPVIAVDRLQLLGSKKDDEARSE